MEVEFQVPRRRAARNRSNEVVRLALRRYVEFLMEPIDGASIAVFRMLVGMIMLWEVGRFVAYGWITEDYVEPTFFFSFVPYLEPWPGDGMYVHFFAMGVLAILIAVGLFYRAAALLFCLAFTYVFLLDKAQYQNHFYLICLTSALMALIPAHHAWSLDRAFGMLRGDGTVPRWCLHALRAQIVLVYVFGGIAKINEDWLRGEPIGTWLLDLTDMPLVGPLFALPYAGLVFAWSGLFVDLSIGFLLLLRRTFWFGVLVASAFHLINSQIFTIGIFPFFMLATLVLFSRPGWPRTLLETIERSFLERDTVPRPGAIEGSSEVRVSAPAPKRGLRSNIALIVLLHVYFVIQIALPLRHWLYSGDVNWTEEGHHFSWRMKLRDKEVVEFNMTATDPRTGETLLVDPHEHLSPRQYRKMAVRPDMIHQFAHHAADEYEAERGVRPRITVRVRASLNGAPAQLLIDPSVDLAAEPWSHGPAAWIVPLADR